MVDFAVSARVVLVPEIFDVRDETDDGRTI